MQSPGSDASPGTTRRRLLQTGAASAIIAGTGMQVFSAASARAAVPAAYRIRFDQPRQKILGIGFEIMSDTIASGNAGLPTATSPSVPYDLTPQERERFFHEMLPGFRYCRLALGLYLRGTDATQTHIVERFPGQMRGLTDMIRQARIEGVSAEYWSPAPAWKSTGSYIGGTLKAFDPGTLGALGNAMRDDLHYLTTHGVPPVMWGLQNEPVFNTQPYSCCGYDDQQYYQTFKSVAPKIRASHPNAMIHVDSWNGWSGPGSALISADPDALRYVDAWTYHQIAGPIDGQYNLTLGPDSNLQMTEDLNSGASGKPVFNNEFEYLDDTTSPYRTINTAQSIMNWMTFQNAPTWLWGHALKPITNAEAAGYSLGYWRPPDDEDFSSFPDLKPGHWDYNPENWNAVSGFLRHLQWNSTRYQVDEPTALQDQRILAWRAPDGTPAFAITNRSSTTPFTFAIDPGEQSTFKGYRYGPAMNDTPVGTAHGPTLAITVPPLAIEFWVGARRPAADR